MSDDRKPSESDRTEPQDSGSPTPSSDEPTTPEPIPFQPDPDLITYFERSQKPASSKASGEGRVTVARPVA